MTETNAFDQAEDLEAHHDRFERLLVGIPAAAPDIWDAAIVAAVQDEGAEAIIEGPRIVINFDGHSYTFRKVGTTIRSERDVIADDYDTVQIELANDLAAEMSGQIAWDHGRKSWLRFDLRWNEDKVNYSEHRVVSRVKEIRAALPNVRANNTRRNEMGRTNYVNGLISLMKVNPRLAKHIEQFDLDKWILGTPDGYLDLNTQEMMEPNPDLLISKTIAVSLKPSAKCPKWEKFLEQAHKGQEDVIPWLQKFAGLCLTGTMRDEMLAYFYGEGGNGKSVFTSVMMRILGEYSKAAQDSAFTIAKQGYRGHSQEIATLKGARIVISSEPEEGRMWDMGRVKQWTGNEGAISANLMRQNAIDFEPHGKLVLVANEKLKIAKVDAAVRRRLNLVPWPNKPKKVDKTLKDELFEKEAAGILNWMLKGLQLYLKEGLEMCETIRTATAEYLDNQDRIQRFIDDCLETSDTTSWLGLADVESIYNDWAQDAGEDQIKRGLGEKLSSKGVNTKKSMGVTKLWGFTLTEEGMDRMSNVISWRITNRKLKKKDAGQWTDIIKRYQGPDDREYLTGMFGDGWYDDEENGED